MVFSGGEDGFCRLWEFPRRDLEQTREVNCSLYGVINCLTTKHKDFHVVLGTQLGYILGVNIMTADSPVVLYNMKTVGIQSIECAGEKEEFRMAAVSNHGHLISYYQDNWYDKKIHERFGLCCTISNNGQVLATGGSDGKIKLFRFQGAKFIEDFILQDSQIKWIWCLQFSFDGLFLFVSSSEGVVQMWSLRDRCIKRNYRGHKKSVVTLALFEYSKKKYHAK